MKYKIVVLMACFLIFLSATVIAAPLIVNGGFETGDFTGWTIGAVSFDGSITNADAHSGVYSLEMGAVDWVSQSFSSVETTGDLTFWVKGTGFSGPSNIKADYSDGTFDDLTIGGAQISNDDWIMFTLGINNSKDLDTITLSVWESAPILFDDFSLEGPGGGNDTVPEPATMFLLGIGLLSLAGVNRKKR